MLQQLKIFHYEYDRNLKCDLLLDALRKIKNVSLRLPSPPFFLPSLKKSRIFKTPPLKNFKITAGR